MVGMRRRMTEIVASALLLLAAAPVNAEVLEEKAAEESKAEVVEQAAPQAGTADALKVRVMELAAKGEMSKDLTAAFEEYAAARAKERFGDVVPESFWRWLEESPDVRRSLLVGLHPDYNPEVGRCLQELRQRFGPEIDKHTNLALAFAFVWGSARGLSMREPLMGYLEKERPVPTMAESFDYYLKHERMFSSPFLKTLPWQLLAYVADNDIPIDEREWAAKKYGLWKAGVLGKIYYRVDYDDDQLRGNPKIGDRPHTLMNILKYGGVCADRAYFASRVLKSVGVPGMYDCGEGKRGGHAWVAWFAPSHGRLIMRDSGRFDYDKYYTGDMFCPVTRSRILDRDVELMAVALTTSERGYSEALIGSYAYELFEPDARQDSIGVLKTAVYCNPYCARTWRTLAEACADGVLPLKDGRNMYSFMLGKFDDYPDLTYEVLRKLLAVKLEASEEVSRAEVGGNLRLLEVTFELYNKKGRPDLALMLRSLQGQYLESVALKQMALKLYVDTSQKYAKRHYGFLDLFDRALALMDDEQYQKMRLNYLGIIANKVPKYQGSFNRKFKLTNPSYEHVVAEYIDALIAVGRNREAEKWEKELEVEEERD